MTSVRPKITAAAVLILLLGAAGRVAGPLGWRDAARSISLPSPSPTAALHTATARPTSHLRRNTEQRRPPGLAALAPKQTQSPARRVSPAYLVLIVLDGALPDYFAVSNIPHVRALMQRGTTYTNAWAGILESETPSGHATIATGSQPQEDGILSFDWANSDNVPVNLFSEPIVRSGEMEQIMRTARSQTIAGLVHRQNRAAKVVALSGYKYYAADAIGGPDADAIMYYTNLAGGRFGPTAIPGHVPPASVLNAPGLILPSRSYPLGEGNHMAMKLASVSFQEMHQKVSLINLPEFDWPLGHVNGASRDPKDVSTLMQRFDADLGMLEDTYRRAGVLDRTLFVLTADHGFSLIDHKISHNLVNKVVAAAGTSIVRDTYHTAGYVWIKDKSKAATVAGLLAAKQNPYIQAVYFKTIGPHGPTYLRATGSDLFRTAGVEEANQYLLGTFSGPNSPDVVILLKEHTMLVAGAESTWKGDHGGSSWEAQHLPLILSGPGVRHGYVSTYPAPLMDVAPTALALLGVPVSGMQGIPLADAMKASTPAQTSAQRNQGRALWPVILPLKSESQLELRAGQ